MEWRETIAIGTIPFIFWSSSASAGRPLVVDDAPPVAEGHIEAELGAVQSYPNNGGWNRGLPVMAVGLGLGKGVEAGFAIQRLDSNLKGEPRRRGFEDLHLNGKYQFLDERRDFPALALAFDLKFPTAGRRKGLSSGKTDEGITLITTKTFDPLALDLNLGYLIAGRPTGEKLENRIQGGLALRRPLRRDWLLVGEISGRSRETSNGENEAHFQVGIRYQLTPAIALDAGAGRSLRATGTRIQTTFGLTWLLPLGF